MSMSDTRNIELIEFLKRVPGVRGHIGDGFSEDSFVEFSVGKIR